MSRIQVKKFLPLFILAGAAAIAVLMVMARPDLVTREGEVPLPLVKVIAVQKGQVPITIVAHGNVSAWRELELVAEVTGRVIWVSPDFEQGKQVAPDSPLLRIDATDYQLALAEAKAALATAELSLADARALKRKAAIGEAEANVEAARKRITKAEKDLANTEIKAPYNAVIDTQLVELGQYIVAGKTVARVLGSDRAEVRLPVIAADVGFLKPQRENGVVLAARIGQQEQQWKGRLTNIEARVDEQTRVFPVVVVVDFPLDPEKHTRVLPFGLFVRAEVPGTPIPDAVLVPRSALHGGNSVYVVVDGKLRRREVAAVRSDSSGVTISGGLEDGDAVVTTRLDLMFDGMPVAVSDG